MRIRSCCHRSSAAGAQIGADGTQDPHVVPHVQRDVFGDLRGDPLVPFLDRPSVAGPERADRHQAVDHERADGRGCDQEHEPGGDPSHRLACATTRAGFHRQSVPMTSGLESEGTSKVPAHRACRFGPRDEDRRRIVVEHLLQLGDRRPRLVVAVRHAQPIERAVGGVVT